MHRRTFLGLLVGLIGLCWPTRDRAGNPAALPLNPAACGGEYPEPPLLDFYFSTISRKVEQRAMWYEGGALVRSTMLIVTGIPTVGQAEAEKLLRRQPHTVDVEVYADSPNGYIRWTGGTRTPC